LKGVLESYMRGLDEDRETIAELTGCPMATHSRQIVPYNEEGRSHYA
jgi:hypothetical protein